jgi:predicted transcriptional regulator
MQAGAIGRTALAQRANINYKRLLELLKWLDERELVEYIITRGRIEVKLTDKVRKFALVLIKE